MANSSNTSQMLALFRSRWPVADWESTGFFTEDFLHRINPHWLQFAPPDPQSHYWLALLYSIIMVVGVAGNSLVIYMFLRRRNLRTPANILVMNLAVSDFFLLLKMPLFIYNCLHLGPALGEFGCSLYGFVGGLTGTVSIMTLAAISVDRYSVIVHPMVVKARQKIYLTVLLLWLYGGVLAAMPLLDIGFNRYTPEGYLTSCSFDYLTKDLRPRVMIFIFFCMAWVVPFCIITACYTGICRCVLRVRTEPKRSQNSSRHCKESSKRQTEIKVAAVVVGIVGLWFLSWTPYAVVALLGVTGREDYVTPLSSMLPALFCKLASCVDPYVYAVTHPRFRQELKAMVRNASQRQRSQKLKKDILQVRRRSSVEEVMVMMNLSDAIPPTSYSPSNYPSTYAPGSLLAVSYARGSPQPVPYTVTDLPPSDARQQAAYVGSDFKMYGPGGILPPTHSSGAPQPFPYVVADLPSWYASPFYTSQKTKRSTSLRRKDKVEEEKERITM